MTIAITGANGRYGRAVVDALARAVPAERLVATVRDPARAADLAERGIEVRPGSFDDVADLRAAFAGADTVLINATFFGAEVERRGVQVANAIDAAAASGARRIVLTTWPDLDHTTVSAVQDHVGSEARVRAAGSAWTILRAAPGLVDAVVRDVNWARRDGELVAPAGDAVARPAAVGDLAEATAVVLASDGHEQRVYELRGPDAVSWHDLAEVAGELDARSVPYRPVGDEEYREWLTAQGLPEPVVGGLLELYAAFRSGWAAAPEPTLARLLGRAPMPGIEVVRGRAREG